MKKFFSSLFGKEEQDALPEKRYISDSLSKEISELSDSENGWIYSHVFSINRPKDYDPPINRIYMAAVKTSPDRWTVKTHPYFIKDGVVKNYDYFYEESHLAKQAIRNIAWFDGNKRVPVNQEKFTPITSLPGNWREVANSFGMYADDNGSVHEIEKEGGLITANAFLTREGLKKLYPPPQLERIPDILNWSDFYAHMPCYRALSQPEIFNYFAHHADKVAKIFRWSEEMDKLKSHEKIATSLETRFERVKYTYDFLTSEHYLMWDRASFEDNPRIKYQGDLFILAHLLHTGAKLYDIYTSSLESYPPLKLGEKAAEMLSEISSVIKNIVSHDMGLGDKKAKQLQNLVTVGSYEDMERLLPLRAALDTWKAEGSSYLEKLTAAHAHDIQPSSPPAPALNWG